MVIYANIDELEFAGDDWKRTKLYRLKTCIELSKNVHKDKLLQNESAEYCIFNSSLARENLNMPKKFKENEMAKFFVPEFMCKSLSKETKALVLCLIS